MEQPVTSIFKYLNSFLTSEFLPIHHRFKLTLVVILLIITKSAFADGLVTQVDGEVNIKTKGFKGSMPLKPGAWISENEKPEVNSRGNFTILCLSSGEKITVNSINKNDIWCKSKKIRKLRSGDETDFPVVLIPNQRSLNKIEHLVWTGIPEGIYKIIIKAFDLEGFEADIDLPAEFNNPKSSYSASGIHQLHLAKPFNLPLEDIDYYEIIVLNTNNSRSSAEDADHTSQVDSDFPKNLIKKLSASAAKHNIDINSDLFSLAIAAQLVVKGYRAQAYSLIQTLDNPKWKTTKQLLKTLNLRIPSVPPHVMVGEYGETLKLAINSNDQFNAAVACKGFTDYAQVLPSKDLDLINHYTKMSHFKTFCPIFKQD